MPVKKRTPPAARGKRSRALFFLPGKTDPVANVWVELGTGTVTLLYDYGPALAPAAGWDVLLGAQRYEVRSVAGRTLTIAAIGGA